MDEREPVSSAPRRRSIPVLVLVLVLLALAGGAMFAVYAVHRWAWVSSWVQPAQASATTASRASSTPVAAQPRSQVAIAADPALAERVDAIGEQVEGIDARVASASGDADLAEGLMIAFAARRMIDRGQPLGYLEGQLREHFTAAEPRAVAMVIGAAQHPVTLWQLQNRLDELTPELTGPSPDADWWSGVRREIGNLLVVRRADAPPSAPEQVAGRAVRALAQGQVEAALAEVARMPGASRAAGWIADARRYVFAHGALDRLETSALLRRAPAAVPPLAAIEPSPATSGSSAEQDGSRPLP